LGIVEEEADESAFWMELIMDDGLLKTEPAQELHKEAIELTAIMAASRISAFRNRKLKSEATKATVHRRERKKSPLERV
jgi:hypothetical protein